jgi:hypothetical protein
MRDGRAIVAVLVGLMACGGGGSGKRDTTGPTGGGGGDDGGGGGGGGGDDGEVMVPPEKMDEIGVRLDRKRPAAARCLNDAVLAGDAPKSSKGKIALSFVISPAGKAGDVKVTKTSIESQVVMDCVMEKVREIGFPELPRSLEWSYIFALESN